VAELVDLPAVEGLLRQAGALDSGGRMFVYAIQSIGRNYIYVGMTGDLDRRLSEHNRGKEKTTRSYRPFELLHVEVFPDRQSARVREKYLKSGIGKDFLRRLVK